MMEALTGINLAPYAHALRMIWDPEPSNDTVSNAPVWCLGRSYRLSSSGTQSPRTPAKSEYPPLQSSSLLETPPDSISSSFDSSLAYDETQEARGWPPAFRDDFESRIWLSYRSGFELIPRSQDPKALSALSFKMRLKTQLIDHDGFTSDSGWGCMIRTGQSLLANAMLLNTLGRNWRRAAGDNGEFPILAKFADDPRAPYSVHNFVNHGTRACGMYPGEWFGPSATARCIQALTSQHDDPLRVYSTADGSDVYQDAFFEVAKEGDTFHPTLILVSTRLGIDKITPVYWEALIASLQMPQSVGIAGGRPSSSHYFVGAQGQYLFFLDPHTTQPALPYKTDPDDYTLDEVNTCHTRRLRCLHVKEMDPSMLIGFLIKDEEDWDDWRRCVKHVQGKAVINVADSDPVAKGLYTEREGAIDEVETLSDDEDTWLDK